MRIPTTAEVRENYTLDIIHTADGKVVGFETSPENLAEFDRWLEQHDKEVAQATEARIIKLLEAKHTITEDEYHIMSCFGCNAIALIKGEK